MKAVILAGGKGTRITEETKTIPKPMIYIGDKPILHHIMDIFISQGIDDFIIPVGYKSEIIFGYFLDKGNIFTSDTEWIIQSQDFKVTIVNTGMETLTGGRIGRLKKYITDDFFFTYGDGLSDVILGDVLREHIKASNIVTLTAVPPIPRFGNIEFVGDTEVRTFGEKDLSPTEWINGGFGVLSPEIFEYLDGDNCNIEKDVFPGIALEGKMGAIRHGGFWQCMDTYRDYELLNRIYQEQGAIWLKS